MSTFDGEIVEIPGISVDNFNNNQQKCYFLSHVHSDHLKGLTRLGLVTGVHIYMTSISALFIRERYPHLVSNIRELEIGFPLEIEVLLPDDRPIKFVVTALSAGHCPGSCMLLFQLEGCDILYTGDFRISLRNAQNIKVLHELRTHPNFVIYLDSTFMKKSFPKFPSQTESVKKIARITGEYLRRSENHKVNLCVPARYGYEYLLMELHDKLGSKIHVSESDVYEQYIAISKLDGCVTMDPLNAKIFLKPIFLSKIKETKEKNALNIHISAMYWRNWTGGSFTLKTGSKTMRVCYATHNSFEEISDFLLFLEPKKVHLNVLPANHDEKIEMLELLKSIQNQYLKELDQTIDEPPKRFTFKRLRSIGQQQHLEESFDKKLKNA